MKRRLAAVAAGCIVFFLAITGAVYNAAGGEEAETSALDAFTIENKGYKSERKGPVPFTHRKHAKEYGVSCWDCHHEFKGGKNVWSPWEQTQQCSECHDPVKSKDKVVNLQKAYHKTCRDCHAKLGTGPYRKCFGCHTQESEKK